MKQTNTKKLAVAAVFCAVAVAGSLFSFPVFGSKCSPVQHMVNILCAVLLGPGYGLGAAFAAALIRNLLGLGSLMAFPGSMFGALICGLVYQKTQNIPATLIGEVFGTSVLGGLTAYPVAVFLMGKSAAGLAFYHKRSEEHTSELQSRSDLVCRLLLEKKKNGLGFLLQALFFFFNDTATTEIYTLSLHDALPISYPRVTDHPRGEKS